MMVAISKRENLHMSRPVMCRSLIGGDHMGLFRLNSVSVENVPMHQSGVDGTSDLQN